LLLPITEGEDSMQHPEDKKNERLGDREIRVGASAAGKATERKHGRVYRWLDNFWYHYKWHTVAVLFVAVVLTVCIVQLVSRDTEADVDIVMAGPYSFTTREEDLTALRACLATYLPADFDESGDKKVKIISYSFYSEEEIEDIESRLDENGEPLGVKVDTAQNANQYEQFYSYLRTGSSSLYFLSPSLYEELAERTSTLVDLKELLGVLPEGALLFADGEGNSVCLGVRLGDTALYRENSAVRTLPEDTVICLTAPFVFGSSSNTEQYEHAVSYIKALMGIQ